MIEEGFEGHPVEGTEKPFLEDLAEVVQEVKESENVEVDLLAKAKEYGLLNEQKRQLEAELELVGQKMKAINEAICEKMILENPNIKVCVGTKKDGKPLFKTVFVKSTIWAGYAETEEGDGKEKLMVAMKQAGLGDMVKESFNVQTLSGYVRSLNPDLKDPDELKKLVPEVMQPFLKLSKVVALSVKS